MANINSDESLSKSLEKIESKTALELLQRSQKRKRCRANDNDCNYAKVVKDENDFIEYPYLTLLRQHPVVSKNKRYSLKPFEIGLGITEISGAAGCGKTQICIGLCVSCVLSTTIWRDHYVDTVFNTSAGNNTDKSRSHISIANEMNRSYNHKTSSAQNSFEKYDGKKFNNMIESTASITRNSLYMNTPIIAHCRDFSAIYLCLGDEGDHKSQLSNRMDQMIRSRMLNHQRSPTDSSSPLSLQQTIQPNHISSLLSRILIRHLRNLDEFRNFIFSELPSLLSYPQKEKQEQQIECNNCTYPPKKHKDRPNYHMNQGETKVGLIVFDSISGIFRNWDEIDSNDNKYSSRSCEFFSTSAQLKRISESFHVPIVFANQVTAKMNSNLKERLSTSPSQSITSFIPALGLSWSHCVNTRYLLTRKEIDSADANFEMKQSFTKHKRADDLISSNFERHISLILSSNLFMENTVSDSNGVPFKINATGAILST